MDCVCARVWKLREGVAGRRPRASRYVGNDIEAVRNSRAGIL